MASNLGSPSAPAAFLAGVADPWRALGFLISRPALWPLAALPFLLSFGVYAALLGFGWNFFHGWLSGAFLDEHWAWRILGYILAVLFWIVGLIFAAVAFIPLAAAIASPFNDMLSEKVERIYMGLSSDEPFALARFFRAIRIGLAGEIMRLLTVGVLLGAAWFLNFIPGVGQILWACASTLISVHFLSLQFTSYSMDRRFYRWNERRAFLARHRARTLGFGAMAFAVMIIPIVNALFIPVAAIAGTLLFCDTELAERRDRG